MEDRPKKIQLDSETQVLIQHAVELFDKRYNPPVHSTAAALRTKSGEIFTSMNIDHFSAYICAETAALSEAINRNEYQFDIVVAVRKTPEGEVNIANMCGKCRQIFHDYAPGIQVVIDDNSDPAIVTIEELLPYAFTRQRDKIQNLIGDTKQS